MAKNTAKMSQSRLKVATETNNVNSVPALKSCEDEGQALSSLVATSDDKLIEEHHECSFVRRPNQEFIEREASAEDILEASIQFQRNSFGGSSPNNQDLYPSLYHLEATEGIFNTSLDACESPTHLEIIETNIAGEEFTLSATAIAEDSRDFAVATLEEERLHQPSVAISAAAMVADAYNDEFMTRKMMNDELLAQRAKIDSITFSEDRHYMLDMPTSPVAAMLATAFDGSETSIMAEAILEGTDEQQEMKPAAAITGISTVEGDERAACVVEITDEFHPFEFIGDNTTTAEFICEDYSQRIESQPTVTNATITGEADTDITEVAVVLDTQGNVQPNSSWSSASAEATVLGTKPQPEIYRQPEEIVEEISVTGVDEAEATVVAITEDVHPSEITNDGVRAELIGRDFTSTIPPSHSQSSRPQHVTMIGCAISPAVQYSSHNPFEDDPRDTPAMSRDGLAALDAAESAGWMSQAIGGLDEDLQFVVPSPGDISATGINMTGNDAPMAIAEVMDGFETIPPLPPMSGARREWSHASSGGRSSLGAESEASPRTIGMTSRNSSLDSSSDRRVQHRQNNNILSTAASSAVRSTNIVMERLFGDTALNRRRVHSSFDIESAASSILPRTLLPWSVFPSETTGMWVATVNTNQKALDNNNISEASKALRAFSVPTKQQAEALALAWAPPRMLAFSDNHKCYVCDVKFAVFRRPCHCRNCGVCVCSVCAMQWPSKMIPDTYNIKQESVINICKSCDWLCSAFRLALLEGKQDQAVALHASGNVNLVTPFANIKGELFYPVHCAVLGGSLALLMWLVDEHCCPLRSIRISGRTRESSGFTPILTSRGRSLLGIAMEEQNVDLIRYLVVDKGMPLTGEKELSMQRMIVILDRVLRLVPQDHHRNEIEVVEPAYATIPQSSLATMPGASQQELLPPIAAANVNSQMWDREMYDSSDENAVSFVCRCESRTFCVYTSKPFNISAVHHLF